VASRVLRNYREATKDTAPTVIVSTASPFKFCDSVLDALGERADGPRNRAYRSLSALTGLKAPAPLCGPGFEEIRFSDCVERGGMRDAVDAFLR
jgi:threonine synthase